MSVAHNFPSYGRPVPGGAAAEPSRRIGAPRRERTAARTLRLRRLLGLGILAWAVIMAISLGLVHVNSRALAEAATITNAREELGRLEKRNQELDSLLVKAASLSEVERWATEHGMVRPSAMKKLSGDPAAVAIRSSQPAAGEPETAPPSTSMWGSLKVYLSRLGKAVSFTGRSK